MADIKPTELLRKKYSKGQKLFKNLDTDMYLP